MYWGVIKSAGRGILFYRDHCWNADQQSTGGQMGGKDGMAPVDRTLRNRVQTLETPLRTLTDINPIYSSYSSQVANLIDCLAIDTVSCNF